MRTRPSPDYRYFHVNRFISSKIGDIGDPRRFRWGILGPYPLPMTSEPITPSQCRAARALLRWTIQHLAGESGLGVSTIGTFEQEKHTPTRANLTLLRMVLEREGVEFLPATTGGGDGVRWRDPRRR